MLTVSDGVVAGTREDRSGDLLEELLREDGHDVARRIVPDERAEIAAALRGMPFAAPAPEVISDLVSEHYEAMLGFYGREHGVRIARKHLGWYADAAGAAAECRAGMMRCDDPAHVLRLIADAFAAEPERAAA